ncbi:MAG: SprT family zinc-dependent metalloprotease, partial [Rikenellaceae bacterium]|nr:SprT family zinc-dependent metalloprotease [Rikenellaceae bacterium]
FAWNKKRTAFGLCDFERKRIVLSLPWVEANSRAVVKNYALHEIAHVLAGARAVDHGRRWKRIALAIGCDGEEFVNPETLYQPFNHRYKCEKCELTIFYARLVPAHQVRCTGCGERGRGSFTETDYRFALNVSKTKLKFFPKAEAAGR